MNTKPVERLLNILSVITLLIIALLFLLYYLTTPQEDSRSPEVNDYKPTNEPAVPFQEWEGGKG